MQRDERLPFLVSSLVCLRSWMGHIAHLENRFMDRVPRCYGDVMAAKVGIYTLVRCYPTITAAPSDICQTSRLFCETNRSGFHVFGSRGLRSGSNAHQPSFHLSSANRRPVAILPSARSDRYRPAKPAAVPLRYECT